MLVVSNVLDETSRVGCWLAGGVDDLEVDGEGGLVRERADFPGRSLTDSDLGLADGRSLLVGRDDVTDDSRDLELLRGLREGKEGSRSQVSTTIFDARK